MKKQKKVTPKFKTRKRENTRYMICRNSIEDKNFWGWTYLEKHPRCKEWVPVGPDVTATLCHRCVNKTVESPDIRGGYKSSGRIRGWQFMKEFVHKDGTVFHKGIEQPTLKGTLEPTEAKPEKKKLSKSEKLELRNKVMQQMAMVRGELKSAKFKKDIKSGNIKLRRFKRQLDKL